MTNKDLFAFLDRPALQAAAVPETSPLVVDECEARLKASWQWPTGYPASRKTIDHCIRFHYRQTNDSQAKTEFQSILLMYRNHVQQENLIAVTKYPYLEQYLQADPLGTKVYPETDVNIYKNATKLVAERHARENATRDARITAAEVAATASAVSAADVADGKTVPAAATGSAEKSAKPSKKKSRKSQRARRAAAAGTRVKTEFACCLAKIQRDLYACLPALKFLPLHGC